MTDASNVTKNLRDRLDSVGGRLSIASSPGRTVVSGIVPLRPH